MTHILGLTCISEQLKDKDKKKYSFQTMTRKRFNDLCVKHGKDEAIKQLSDRILHNVIVTQYIINHCNDRSDRIGWAALVNPNKSNQMELPVLRRAALRPESNRIGCAALTR